MGKKTISEIFYPESLTSKTELLEVGECWSIWPLKDLG